MSDCETCEISISALADGELPPEDLLPTLDHLAECPSCQAFYRDLRMLAAALPVAADRTVPSEMSEEASEEIWRRIEGATAPAPVRTGRARPWATRLAAALLLVAGLGGALAAARSALGPVGAPIEITLGEDCGRMTEQRFVDLTVELLRSDTRYHHEMLQVLTAVLERGGRQEAPADYDAPLPEGDDGDSPAPGARRFS
jgi:predicted anti-sigma-YlaC factor YlaD